MKCTSCGSTIPNYSKFCNKCGHQQDPQQAASKPKRKKTKAANGMGYVFKRGNVWYIRFRDYQSVAATSGLSKYPKCLEVTRAIPDAKTKAEAQEKGFLIVKGAPKTQKNLTIAYYWDVYERDTLSSLAKTKQVNYRTAYNRLAPLHMRQIKDLTVKDVRDIVYSTCKTYYPAKDVKTLLGKLFELAAADDPSINKDIPSFIELPALEEKGQQAFTIEEVRRIYQVYENGNWFAGCIILMIYTSLMPGELMKLEPSMIDLENCQILGVGIKTKLRKKSSVVFPSFIKPILEHLIQRSAGKRILEGIDYYEKMSKLYYEVIDAANVSRLTPYACRHTTGTVLAHDPSVPDVVVSRVLRHTKRSTERYLHARDDAAHAAVENMPAPTTNPNAAG